MSDLIARLDFAASSVLVGHPAVARALDDAVAALRQKDQDIAALRRFRDWASSGGIAADEIVQWCGKDVLDWARETIPKLRRELAELRAQQPPREPTKEMGEAGYRAYGKTLYEPRPQGWGECATLIYHAMYDAAIPPRSAEG